MAGEDTTTAPLLSATLAAERYRRATELVARARTDLIAAAEREREAVRLSGLARLAGIDPSTLQHWLAHKARSENGRAR